MTAAPSLGPSDEWIAAYKRETAPPPGKMSIAPKPELAWCCEVILGSYQPAVVFNAIRRGDAAWRQVQELHASIVNAR